MATAYYLSRELDARSLESLSGRSTSTLTYRAGVQIITSIIESQIIQRCFCGKVVTASPLQYLGL
jgi:hypothetical protein